MWLLWNDHNVYIIWLIYNLEVYAIYFLILCQLLMNEVKSKNTFIFFLSLQRLDINNCRINVCDILNVCFFLLRLLFHFISFFSFKKKNQFLYLLWWFNKNKAGITGWISMIDKFLQNASDITPKNNIDDLEGKKDLENEKKWWSWVRNLSLQIFYSK